MGFMCSYSNDTSSNLTTILLLGTLRTYLKSAYIESERSRLAHVVHDIPLSLACGGTTILLMILHRTQRYFLPVLVVIILALAGTAHAKEPVIYSFSADTQSLSSGYSTAFSWNTASSTGRDFFFNCPLGVTIKKSDGSNFPCNTRSAVSGSEVDWASFFFTNVSGAAKNVSVTMYPKDSNGVNYDQGFRNVTISVETTQQPIATFSLSTSTVVTDVPLTLTWKGVDASGVNLQFECADFIKIRTTAAGTVTLPCGRPALTADLPVSGSYTVYPLNSSRAPVTVTVRVFPQIGGGTYDATHSKVATFEVQGAPLPASPSVSEFTSSATRLASNGSFTLSWATQASTAANIQFQCQEGLSVFASTSTAAGPLPCGRPALSTPLATKGSITFSIKNTNTYGVNLGILLLPQDAAGIYFQTKAMTLSIPVLPLGAALPAPAASTSAVSPVGSASAGITPPPVPQTSAAPVKSALPKYMFKRALMRGARNADVTALQKFLAQYKDIYPAGFVTGFFGPATEKAVGLFQEKYGIAKKGDEAYGGVGPKTRAKLNSMQ